MNDTHMPEVFDYLSAQERDEVTSLLHQWIQKKDTQALNVAFELLQSKLRTRAQHLFKPNDRDQTLGATALIAETFIKLQKKPPKGFKNRGAFLSYAALCMRSILTDHYRKKYGNPSKEEDRGQKLRRQFDPLNVVEDSLEDHSMKWNHEYQEVDSLIRQIESKDPVAGKALDLRYTLDLTEGEISKVLEISESTVKRKLITGRKMLARRLERLDLLDKSRSSCEQSTTSDLGDQA